MKKAIVAIMLILFVTVQVQADTVTNTEQAISSSGMTRMLSMKMAKLYGIQTLKDYPAGKIKRARMEMGKMIMAMEGTYKALIEYSPIAKNREMVGVIKAAQSRWYQMKKMLSVPPSKTGFQDVLDISDTLLDDNEMMTSYIESLSPVPISEIINMAGRQRMYSQKIARDYLAASMGIDKEYRMDLMVDAAVEFESAMLMMEGASENTAAIKGLIKSITRMEWRKVYKTATECVESNGIKFNVGVMIKFCDTLADKAGRLTSLYVATAQS